MAAFLVLSARRVLPDYHVEVSEEVQQALLPYGVHVVDEQVVPLTNMDGFEQSLR